MITPAVRALIVSSKMWGALRSTDRFHVVELSVLRFDSTCSVGGAAAAPAVEEEKEKEEEEEDEDEGLPLSGGGREALRANGVEP